MDIADSSDVTSPREQKEEWAVRVDIKTPVEDFYKRIPDMAFKVTR